MNEQKKELLNLYLSSVRDCIAMPENNIPEFVPGGALVLNFEDFDEIDNTNKND